MIILWGIPTDLAIKDVQFPRGGPMSNYKLKQFLGLHFNVVNPRFAASNIRLLKYLGFIFSINKADWIALESSYIMLGWIFKRRRLLCIVRDLNLVANNGIRGALYRKSLNSSDLIIVNSQFMKGKVKEILHIESYIFVLYPDIGEYTLGHIAHDRKSIAFVSSKSTDDKGYEIVNKIAELRPSLVIHIYGSWNSKLNPRSNLKYMGYRPFYQISSETRLMLIPSVWEEPFGRVALEAVRSGMMVLASATGGLEEILPERCLVRKGLLEFLIKLDRHVEDNTYLALSNIERLEIIKLFKPDYIGLKNVLKA